MARLHALVQWFSAFILKLSSKTHRLCAYYLVVTLVRLISPNWSRAKLASQSFCTARKMAIQVRQL
jgi:hypothetical protein